MLRAELFVGELADAVTKVELFEAVLRFAHTPVDGGDFIAQPRRCALELVRQRTHFDVESLQTRFVLRGHALKNVILHRLSFALRFLQAFANRITLCGEVTIRGELLLEVFTNRFC